ncbi:hypothetical protein ACFRCI_47785 [Streptomyces sp. NPDC056638]|uniref:hypothetical protein n=1 Tax=Streptomyces sp. NPDC056638 TaxID=3345887 RepID=UPI0036B9B5FC
MTEQMDVARLRILIEGVLVTLYQRYNHQDLPALCERTGTPRPFANEARTPGVSGVRPLRRPMVFDALESQYEPTVGVERRPALAERPPRIRLVHYAAER